MYGVWGKDEYKCIVIVDGGISLKVDVLVQVWLDCVNEQWLKADVNKQCDVIMTSEVHFAPNVCCLVWQRMVYNKKSVLSFKYSDVLIKRMNVKGDR